MNQKPTAPPLSDPQRLRGTLSISGVIKSEVKQLTENKLLLMARILILNLFTKCFCNKEDFIISLTDNIVEELKSKEIKKMKEFRKMEKKTHKTNQVRTGTKNRVTVHLKKSKPLKTLGGYDDSTLLTWSIVKNFHTTHPHNIDFLLPTTLKECTEGIVPFSFPIIYSVTVEMNIQVAPFSHLLNENISSSIPITSLDPYGDKELLQLLLSIKTDSDFELGDYIHRVLSEKIKVVSGRKILNRFLGIGSK